MILTRVLLSFIVKMNMYFLERKTSESTRFYTCGHKVGSPWFFVSWVSGQPLNGKVPVPVEYNLDKDLPLGDFVFTVARQVLVSERLLNVIKTLSPSLEVFPSIIRFKDKKVYSDYYTINFVEAFNCADWERSEYTVNEDFADRFKDYTRIVLSAGKLPSDALFRLGEDRVKLVINEAGKRVIEEGGFSGIEFKQVEAF